MRNAQPCLRKIAVLCLGDIANRIALAPTYILLSSGIWCNSIRFLAVSRLRDAILWGWRRCRSWNWRWLRRKQRRLSRGISVRLEAEQDAQRHGDGDGQQRGVDEDADRHGWRKRRKKRASKPQELREGERASVVEGRWDGAVEERFSDGFCRNHWRGKASGLKGFLERRRDESQSVSDTRPLRTGTITCTCTGCLGRMYTRYEAGTSANSRLMGGAVPATSYSAH